MRESEAASFMAPKAPPAGGGEAPVRLVCLGLALALLTLAARIASIW